jgi:hypothetical protein
VHDLHTDTVSLAHYETHAESQPDFAGLPLPLHTLPMAISQFFSASDLGKHMHFELLTTMKCTGLRLHSITVSNANMLYIALHYCDCRNACLR